MPASESRSVSKPDWVDNAGNFVSGVYDRVAEFLSQLLWHIFTPSRWLLQKLEKSEGDLRRRLRSASGLTWFLWWIAVQLVRLVSLVVYWVSVGPIYIAVLIAFALLFWAASKPFFFSERVGALWFGALLFWLLSRKGSRIWKSFSNIAGAVAIGVTPQFLFLCAYNGFIDGEMTPPALLQEAIKTYEHVAVWTYRALEPVREIAWFWWVLGALGLLFLTYVSESQRLFKAALWLRGLLASFVFVLAVTTSFSLSSSIRVWNWEPDMNRRLQAAFKETVTHETELNLAEALKDWFASHKEAQTALPGYVQSFEKALRELGQRRDDQGRQDLWKGARTAMKALVPKDLDAVPGEAQTSNHGAERKDAADVSNLLALEAQIKAKNAMLAIRANQARVATVNVIAQVVDVSATSIPLLKEISSEMIGAAAEILSERMLERLPMEKAIFKVQDVASAVKEGISRNIDALALGLFTARTMARPALNGMAADEVKGRISEETHRIAVVREEAERAARETARRARVR
jgi:hypothetical protein